MAPGGRAAGVGMCCGPVFSETPTLLDWLQYYGALGVRHIHMYATVADFVLARGDYMHLPGSHRSVLFQPHHLVTWRAFHASRWSRHYYGQARAHFPTCILVFLGSAATVRDACSLRERSLPCCPSPAAVLSEQFAALRLSACSFVA